MRRLTTLALAIFALALAPTAAGAQAPAAVTLSVDDAVSRAVETAPRLGAARAREAAAASAAASRAALGRPTVAVTSGILRTNHVDEFGIPEPDGSTRVLFPDVPTNYQARAEVDVPVYTAGRVGALVASADADHRAASATAEAARADVALEATSAYWSLVAARDAVGVLERALARADASLADVRARVNTGILPPNDLLSSQAERARERVSLIQAQNDAALSEARLDRLVGLDPGTPLVTSTPVDRETPGVAAVASQPLATLIARARGQRPERQAIEAREAGQRAAGAAALAAVRPHVAALAAVEPARPNTRFFPRADDWHTSWDLGVNVTWPLWDGGRARADHATSVAQASATHYELEDFDDALAVEIRQRVLDVQSARAALDASADAVAAATEARRVVGERFDVGVATNTDRLDAEVAEREAELERTRLAAALRVAEAQLLRAVGAQP